MLLPSRFCLKGWPAALAGVTQYGLFWLLLLKVIESWS